MLAAWLVHVYTASGAVLALLSLRAAVQDDFRMAFAWLFLATVVDASDGWLARRFRVREAIPHFDGGKLDELVDYLTFVFVPAVIAAEAGILPPHWTTLVAGAMLLASAYGFSQDDAKTPDHFFTGFPVLLEHRRLLSVCGRHARSAQRRRPAPAGRARVRADSLCVPLANARTPWMDGRA